MKLLALDTATEACSAAVHAEGATFSEWAVEPRAHTRLILPMVEKVLAAAGLELHELDAVVVGRGPGAFTGIRIGMGVAQGLALAAGKPVIAVSTLAALAQEAGVRQGASHVLAALDARMGEVYWGRYVLQDGIMQLQGEEQVCSPSATPLVDSTGWLGVGSGWVAYADTLQERWSGRLAKVVGDALPAAQFMLPLGMAAWAAGLAVPPEEAQPVYLRNKVALTTQERRDAVKYRNSAQTG